MLLLIEGSIVDLFFTDKHFHALAQRDVHIARFAGTWLAGRCRAPSITLFLGLRSWGGGALTGVASVGVAGGVYKRENKRGGILYTAAV